MADVVPPSTSLAFVTKMSVERKSASPRALTVKRRQQTDRIVEKLHVTSHLVKRERIVDICHNVRFAHVRGLSGKYPATLNISRTGHLALM